MRFEHRNKVFDTSVGKEITIGDMEELESVGVDMAEIAKGSNLKVSILKKIALVCLRRLDLSPGEPIDGEFINSIPVSKMKDLIQAVSDFFTQNFPGGEGS